MDVATAEHYASLTTASRLAFSGRVLLLFVLVGPVVVLVGKGKLVRMPELQTLFPLFYLIGSSIALCAWLVFSVLHLALSAVESRSRKPVLSLLTMATFTTLIVKLAIRSIGWPMLAGGLKR